MKTGCFFREKSAIRPRDCAAPCTKWSCSSGIKEWTRPVWNVRLNFQLWVIPGYDLILCHESDQITLAPECNFFQRVMLIKVKWSPGKTPKSCENLTVKAQLKCMKICIPKSKTFIHAERLEAIFSYINPTLTFKCWCFIFSSSTFRRFCVISSCSFLLSYKLREQ